MKRAGKVFLFVFAALEVLAVLGRYNLFVTMFGIAALGVVCFVFFAVIDFAARKLFAFGAAGAAGLAGLVALRAAKHFAGGAFRPERTETAIGENPQIAKFMAQGLARAEAKSAVKNLYRSPSS